MKLAAAHQLVRNTARFREITTVLARFGLAGWMKDVKADWIQRLFRTGEGEQLTELPFEERVRLALTELGTTFIKLGQILSTRPDLVGPELSAELGQLQSDTPADPPETVRALLRSEFGAEPEELFDRFDEQAMASASVAQIHRAVTKDGRPVAVKIQHDGIEDRIRNDLEILIELAQLAERFAPQLKQVQPLQTAQEFRRTFLRELDFSREARNLQQFARNFQGDDGVRFPAAHLDLTRRRVLTMDLLDGIGVSNRDALCDAGVDLVDVARRGANMFVQMIFRDGFYHADPHPGNLMVLPGDVIGVLDCGMVGRIDDDFREQIEDMLLAAVDQDASRLAEIVVQLGRVPANFDREQLHAELDEFVVEYGGQSIDEFDLSGALNGIVAITRQHEIILPPRLALLLKVLVMLEGTSQKLSPEFSLGELLQPYRAKAMQRRLSPQRMWRKLESAYRDWNHLLGILPGDLSDILTRVKRGNFEVHLEHRRLEATVNRLVMGLITAALFVGSSIMYSTKVPPDIKGVSIPGVLGCVAAVVLGWRLTRAIKRAGDLEP